MCTVEERSMAESPILLPAEEAAALIDGFAITCRDLPESGGMSLSIYDTAWLAMIIKEDDSQRSWLFPESFQFLLYQQLPSGQWESHACDSDGVINTMAGLLALIKHQQQPSVMGCPCEPSDIAQRISNAVSALDRLLQVWDVSGTRNVGFEVIVPALLEYLSAEGIIFRFPGYQSLQSLKTMKLAKFRPDILYTTEKTSVLHSLEALVGKIDFDRVSHHKTDGSMMASPASTAAYLINVTVWDHEAERYLRETVQNCHGKGSGGVPSAFPTPVFEMAWVLSTFLTAGYTSALLGERSTSIVADYLEAALEQGDGTVGFAPGLMADADDTAKVQLALSLLGRGSRFSAEMVSRFACKTHFQTYPSERNPSVSANCNILMALLHCSHPDSFETLIVNAINFVCESWDRNACKDKWVSLDTACPPQDSR
ncbi:MAG: hypothetical protein Q9172_002695 [Xanthocarpia lactea]